MKKLIILVLFVIIGSSAQSQILKKTYYDYQKIKVETVYYVNSLGQNNGLYTKYNNEGAKAVELNYSNGVVNGAGKEFYTRDGVSKLKISGNYKNGEKHGQWITYTYVKYGQSYFDIMQNMYFNDKEADIFNTGVQTKVKDETFNQGACTNETRYYATGKVFFAANYENRRYTGDYLCNNENNVAVAKGKIGTEGKMIGAWIIPREENGDCPRDKQNLSKLTYTQKIKFDNNGVLDTNFMSKSYYLSGKLRDSVRVISLEFPSGYDYNEHWFLCGKNILITGPYLAYYETGKIQTEGQYNIENGISVKVGVWKSYDQNGSLIKETNEEELRTKEKADAEKIAKEKEASDKAAAEKLAKNKEEVQQKLNQEKRIKELPELISSKHQAFEKIYVEQKDIAFLVDNNGQPMKRNTYPKGKNIYEKGEQIYQVNLKLINSEKDNDKILSIGNDIVKLLDKLISIASTDTKDLDKQIIKAETIEDIKKILGL